MNQVAGGAGGAAGGFGAADRYANAMPHDIFRNATNPNNRYNYNSNAQPGGYGGRPAGTGGNHYHW